MSAARALQLFDLWRVLTRAEFKSRDQGTLLGFAWTLLRPLWQFAVLHAVFGRWMAPRVENWAAYLLVGVVMWDLFAGATAYGLTSLKRKAGLVTHFAFPRVLVPLSSASAVLASHALEWLLLLALLPALGVPPRASWLFLPLLVAAEAALAFGAACLLAALAPRLRDLEQAWSMALYALFFLTPVFYTADLVGPIGGRLVALNPLAALIEAARAVLDGGAVPSLAPAFLLAAVAAVAGTALFPRLERGGVERL